MKPLSEIKLQQSSELNLLIEWVGSQSRLADGLGVSKQVVQGWVKRGRISAQSAIRVEKETNGFFKKEGLRPDVIEWNV